VGGWVKVRAYRGEKDAVILWALRETVVKQNEPPSWCSGPRDTWKFGACVSGDKK